MPKIMVQIFKKIKGFSLVVKNSVTLVFNKHSSPYRLNSAARYFVHVSSGNPFDKDR